ncbi:MAG: hypothetical protein IPG10_16290 [Flavobacteriales bacterium]|nr:hypothetical protein [Flavobacteriales bacterium]
MNDLERYFHSNQGRLIHKWMHFFDVYDRHFARYRGKEVVILEIGVFQGGSLQMWKNYFGDKARIYGIDINPGARNSKRIASRSSPVRNLIGRSSGR